MALLLCLLVQAEPLRLENGLTVILRPLPGATQAAVVVLFNVGGDHDPEGRSGLAHLLEHVYVTAAAGPTPARRAEDLFRGGEVHNGQTGAGYTVMMSLVPKEKLAGELRDAAARLGDLRISDADLERERPRLLEETANMYGRIPALAAHNLAGERIRPAPRGGRAGGRRDHVARLTAGALRQRWRTLYKPRNALLSVAGDFDPAKLTPRIERLFGALPSGDPAPEPARPPEARPGPGLERIGLPAGAAGSGSLVAVGFAAPAPADPRYAPFLAVMARLFVESRKLGVKDNTPLMFAPLDHPERVTLSTRVRPGETPDAARSRIEALIGDAAGRPLAPGEIPRTVQSFSAFFWTERVPAAALAGNPYLAAFAPARRLQMGMDAAGLRKRLGATTDADLRRLSETILAPERRAAVLLVTAK